MTKQPRSTAATILISAGAIGAVVGAGSIGMTPQGRDSLAGTARAIAVNTGMQRQRAPQAGDAWGGCDAARAAGTAPIYRDEPGYRIDMDGDGDGIACEPIRS